MPPPDRVACVGPSCVVRRHRRCQSANTSQPLETDAPIGAASRVICSVTSPIRAGHTVEDHVTIVRWFLIYPRFRVSYWSDYGYRPCGAKAVSVMHRGKIQLRACFSPLRALSSHRYGQSHVCARNPHIRTIDGVPFWRLRSRSFRASSRVVGRKRHLLVDTWGLPIPSPSRLPMRIRRWARCPRVPG